MLFAVAVAESVIRFLRCAASTLQFEEPTESAISVCTAVWDASTT